MLSIRNLALAGAAALGLCASAAQAAVTWTVEESGGDVVGTFAGSIDLIGATFVGGGDLASNLSPRRGLISTPGFYDAYGATSVPGGFGLGFVDLVPDGASGDAFGVWSDLGLVFVPDGYVSGAALAGSIRFDGATFASLGLTEGAYVFSLPGDTVTVQIGATTVPLPAGLPLMLAGIGAFAWVRRRA